MRIVLGNLQKADARLAAFPFEGCRQRNQIGQTC